MPTPPYCCLALAAIGLMALAGASQAAGFEGLAPISDQALSQTRAGFTTVEGISFDFGAQLQTFVDGQLALSTSLTLEGDRLARTSVAAGDLGGLLADPAGFGLTLAGGGGVTRLQHGVDGDALRNLVATSASGQTIRQATNLDITLAGFEANQAQYAASQTMRALNASLNFALTATPR